MRLTVGCHKGGVGKTTSAVLIALQLLADGPVILVDGDRQGSALTWRPQAGDEWPGKLEVRRWSEPLRFPRDHHVVIDTPPGDPGRLRTALRASDTALIPVGARRGDTVQVNQTIHTVAEVAQSHPLRWGVFVTMRRGSTLSSRRAPAAIESGGWPLLGTEIPLSEAIAETFGRAPARIPGSYVDLYREITEVAVHA